MKKKIAPRISEVRGALVSLERIALIEGLGDCELGQPSRLTIEKGNRVGVP